MRVEFDGDIPLNTGSFIPGLEIPEALKDVPFDHLRLMGGKVIDGSALAGFFIDPQGRKHAERAPGHRWPMLRCRIDDVLTLEDGKWRVETEAEAKARDALIRWVPVRRERDRLLAESDWTQLPDVPLTSGQRRQWQDYRAALRNITRQPDPDAVEWPQRPE